MKIIEKEFSVETGEETTWERELTPEEMIAIKKVQDETAEINKKALEMAQAKAALLAKLGITEDEAKLLLS